MIDWLFLWTDVFYTGNKLWESALISVSYLYKDPWEPEILLIDRGSNTYFTHENANQFIPF